MMIDYYVFNPGKQAIEKIKHTICISTARYLYEMIMIYFCHIHVKDSTEMQDHITLQNQLQILLCASIITSSNCCQTRLILLYFYGSKYLIKHNDDWIRTIATIKVVYSAEIDENNACHKKLQRILYAYVERRKQIKANTLYVFKYCKRKLDPRIVSISRCIFQQI